MKVRKNLNEGYLPIYYKSLISHLSFVSIVITFHGNFTSNFVYVFSILTLLATKEAQFHLP